MLDLINSLLAITSLVEKVLSSFSCTNIIRCCMFIIVQLAYSEWIVKDHRHIVAVLEDLPSLKPPIDHLVELLPRLQVRYYSISSSQRVRKDVHVILLHVYCCGYVHCGFL